MYQLRLSRCNDTTDIESDFFWDEDDDFNNSCCEDIVESDISYIRDKESENEDNN